MRRTDLTEATMQGWARLDAAQRERFFEAFVKAALRLDALALRAWLRRRLKIRRSPLRSIRPALQFADADIALLLGRRAKRRAKLPPGRTGTRPMAAKQNCAA